MWGCKCYTSVKSIHSSLLSWRDRYLKNSKIKAKMIKSEGLAENNITFMKHIKKVIPYGRDIYAKSYDMANATICTYPQSDHALTHKMSIAMLC